MTHSSIWPTAQRPPMTSSDTMTDSLISHVGIAVADFESAVECYKLITGDDSPVIKEVPDQQVRVAIFATGGSAGRIELISPTSPDSPVARHLARRSEGLHHLCIRVDDLEAKLEELTKAGMKLIDNQPRIGAEGHRIAFVHPAGTRGVLLELEEHS